jgi:methanogenic corrinoid protein MtbC1
MPDRVSSAPPRGSIAASATPRVGLAVGAADLRAIVDVLREHDVDTLRRLLVESQARLGMSRFVLEMVAPLNTMVGEAWMRGRFEIFQEHLYQEQVQVVLRDGLARLPAAAASDRPRVLLSSLPGETHTLGLVMAEAVLAIDGARCTSLGVQTPLWDLVLAASALQSDVVLLGFAGAMNPNTASAALAELRAKLPASVDLWVLGAAPVLHRRPVPGVRAFAGLQDVLVGVQGWRDRVA